MINSEINTTELGTNVTGHNAVLKQPFLSAKKVALKDVQNSNNNLTRNTQTLIPVEGQLFVDASKTCGTKRPTPDFASSPNLTSNGAHEHFSNFRRKYESETNIEKNGKNVQYGSLVGPNQTGSKTYVSRFKEVNEEQRVDRFIRLQNYIKQCDGSDHRENIQSLLRLSPLELSKHAVELEKRAIQLTIEEGKEMQRMQALNILGKPSTTRNPIPITKHTHHKN